MNQLPFKSINTLEIDGYIGNRMHDLNTFLQLNIMVEKQFFLKIHVINLDSHNDLIDKNQMQEYLELKQKQSKWFATLKPG